MAPRPLLLIGAGGLAREILAAVRAMPEQWSPVGVLDDDPALRGWKLDGLPVLGGSERVDEIADAAVVACVANARRPLDRIGLVRRLGLPAHRWATVIHPAACVPAGCDIGPGSVLLAGTVLTTPLRIGSHVLAMPQVLLTHDDEVGDGVTLAGRASLGGGVRVGDGAYLGQGSLVREGVSIGSGAVIGMGSVVLQDVPEGQVWAGVPATKITTSEGNRP